MTTRDPATARRFVALLLQDCALARRLGYKRDSIRAMQTAIALWRKALQGADAAAIEAHTKVLQDRYMPID